ncbi:MAG: hypothetical protein QOG54_2353 [Actinomycetota bacterium]|nr:hypothetical protein [Actinomycetota bacterium]
MGVEGSSRTWGSSFVDYDIDGDTDLFVGRHWGFPKLYNNGPTKAYDAIAIDDLRKPMVDRHACSWGEANGDGLPDLYCVRGADKGHGAGPNQLFLQKDGGYLINRGPRNHITNSKGRGRTVNWIDYDSDGDLDIFVGNETRNVYPNAMFENLGGDFRKTTVGVEDSLSTVSSSWADWDRDGDPDLIVMQHEGLPALAYENVEGHFQHVEVPVLSGEHWNAGAWGDYDGDGWPDLHLVSEGRAVLLHNEKGAFHPTSRIRLNQGRMSAWLDVENDGDLDLFVVQGAAGNEPTEDVNHLDFLMLNDDGDFRVFSHGSFNGPVTGNGDAVAVGDYNGDGLQDVFVTNGLFHWEGRNVLLENHSTSGTWADVVLRGPLTNPFGFGAIVTVKLPGTTYIRETTDMFNFRTQSDPGRVHLGLGKVQTARVRVEWPDGTSDCSLVTAGLVIEISIGTSACSR